MQAIETKIPGLIIILPDCHGDERGWFMETYSEPKYAEIGISNHFVQENHSMSAKKGTLRGLHFQNNPHAQAKLVRCTKGTINDVVVDLRKGSPTFLQWVSVELSGDNKRQLYIPRGFAHGFLTLTDNVEFDYKVDNLYSKECDRGIKYNDPSISIDWSELLNGISPILSEKDKLNQLYIDSDCNFVYEDN